MLHNMQLDLNSATKQLETTTSYLENCRSDEGFQQVLKDATDIATELEIEPTFVTGRHRIRRKNVSLIIRHLMR